MKNDHYTLKYAKHRLTLCVPLYLIDCQHVYCIYINRDFRLSFFVRSITKKVI